MKPKKQIAFCKNLSRSKIIAFWSAISPKKNSKKINMGKNGELCNPFFFLLSVGRLSFSGADFQSARLVLSFTL